MVENNGANGLLSTILSDYIIVQHLLQVSRVKAGGSGNHLLKDGSPSPLVRIIGGGESLREGPRFKARRTTEAERSSDRKASDTHLDGCPPARYERRTARQLCECHGYGVVFRPMLVGGCSGLSKQRRFRGRVRGLMRGGVDGPDHDDMTCFRNSSQPPTQHARVGIEKLSPKAGKRGKLALWTL